MRIRPLIYLRLLSTSATARTRTHPHTTSVMVLQPHPTYPTIVHPSIIRSTRSTVGSTDTRSSRTCPRRTTRADTVNAPWRSSCTSDTRRDCGAIRKQVACWVREGGVRVHYRFHSHDEQKRSSHCPEAERETPVNLLVLYLLLFFFLHCLPAIRSFELTHIAMIRSRKYA